MIRLSAVTVALLTILSGAAFAQGWGVLPTPTPGTMGITYDVDAYVSGGVLVVEGSTRSTDSNGNAAGDVIYLRRYTGPYTRTFVWGGRTYRYTVNTTLIAVMAGVFENSDGSLTVTNDNPFPGGVVLRVPESDIDRISVDLHNGHDTLESNYLNNMPLDVWLGSGNDYFHCNTRSTTDVYVSGGYGNDFIDCFLTGPAEVHGGPGNDHIEGSPFNDVLNGSSGNDTIIGGSGHDVLQGGWDADDLDGGNGIDILIGSSMNLPSWPAPDANGIIFTQSELEDLLKDFHTDDKAGDVLVGGRDNDFIVWWRFQDWIDFSDPDGAAWWINYLFGRVWRDEN